MNADTDTRTRTLILADELRDVAADLLRRADELTAAITDDDCPPHGIERPTPR